MLELGEDCFGINADLSGDGYTGQCSWATETSDGGKNLGWRVGESSCGEDMMGVSRTVVAVLGNRGRQAGAFGSGCGVGSRPWNGGHSCGLHLGKA